MQRQQREGTRRHGSTSDIDWLKTLHDGTALASIGLIECEVDIVTDSMVQMDGQGSSAAKAPPIRSGAMVGTMP